MTLDQLLDLVLRWAHLIAGIMWIGNSMLFNWLDRNLIKSSQAGRLSQGTIWMVHSGAFYEVEKKLLEPGQLPTPMHWFKWQNFATWATGVSLLVVVYYWNDAAFLRDPSVARLTAAEAISISVLSLVAGWLIYDLMWRFLGDRLPQVATALSIAMLFGAAWGFAQVFNGRAAYIQTGVLMGTVMTGNVWMRIMPSQRELIRATRSGEEQDATLSIRAKQRSIHNNYLTFPLLFIMVSNHFSATWGSHLNWLMLIAVMIGGAGLRHFMNVRYAGAVWLAPALILGAVTLAGIYYTAGIRKASVAPAAEPVAFEQVHQIILTHCIACHSANATDPLAAAVPRDVKFDDPQQIQHWAARIHERAAVLRTMPFNNKTVLSEEEIAALKRWYADGAKIQ